MTKMRHGESYADEENEHDLMIKLVERYSNFEEVQIGTQTGNGTNDIEGGADVVVIKIPNLRRSKTLTRYRYLLELREP